MSRIAKGPIRPAVQKQALARDSQRRRSRPPCIEMRGSCRRGEESHRHRCRGRWGLCGNGESVMRNPIEIDHSHSRAIIQEIGERLRTLLKEDRELTASLRLQIDRLRQLEGESQPNVPRPPTRWWARRPPTRG